MCEDDVVVEALFLVYRSADKGGRGLSVGTKLRGMLRIEPTSLLALQF